MQDFRDFLGQHPIPNGGIVRMRISQRQNPLEYGLITTHLESHLLQVEVAPWGLAL